MNNSELETVYTRLCQTMTQLGESQAPLFLARFALLASVQVGQAEIVERLIADAAEGLAQSAPD
ncbi:MAG: hypothetical protein OEY03_12920 [Rhizobacter sp.]|nr:hypothetical protein [Rhizobacter sp.]